MLENLFGNDSLAILGVLAALTTILVQFFKDLIPKKIPTKLVALVFGIGLSIFFGQCNGFDFEKLIENILTGCVVAFISMNGFDSLKEIWQRFNLKGGEQDESKDI